MLKAFYFRNFESTYRILHIPSFNNEYERYWVDPSAVDDGWVFTLLLILAIGSCFVRDLAWSVNPRPYPFHTKALRTNVLKADSRLQKVNRTTSYGYEVDLPR